jgi:cytochrome c oxidase subunit II
MTMTISRRQAIGAAGALALGSVAAFAVAAPKARVIKIVAKKFVYVPSEIHVKQGETVLLELTAPEVPMGFSLPDLSTRVDVIPGKVASLKITPDKTGSFTFLCDVFCGTGHEDMAGTLVVT